MLHHNSDSTRVTEQSCDILRDGWRMCCEISPSSLKNWRYSSWFHFAFFAPLLCIPLAMAEPCARQSSLLLLLSLLFRAALVLAFNARGWMMCINPAQRTFGAFLLVDLWTCLDQREVLDPFPGVQPFWESFPGICKVDSRQHASVSLFLSAYIL